MTNHCGTLGLTMGNYISGLEECKKKKQVCDQSFSGQTKLMAEHERKEMHLVFTSSWLYGYHHKTETGQGENVPQIIAMYFIAFILYTFQKVIVSYGNLPGKSFNTHLTQWISMMYFPLCKSPHIPSYVTGVVIHSTDVRIQDTESQYFILEQFHPRVSYPRLHGEHR